MKWRFEKFKGDSAIYGICTKCNYSYEAGSYNPATAESSGVYQYKYCPICGRRLYIKPKDGTLDVVWNERLITDFWEQKYGNETNER